LVDRASFVLNGLQCFGIARLSVSKVDVLKGSIEAKHLLITCTLTVQDKEIPTDALIDCGAMGIAFMDQDFARHHQIQFPEMKDKKPVEVIDRRPIESRDIMHIAQVSMEVEDHKAQLPMFIPTFGHYSIVSGIPSLS
jgi:hypothetical protein